MPDEITIVEEQIDKLLLDDEYVQLSKFKPEFDLFAFLEALSENASSRALAHLLDSSQDHGFGTKFFDLLIDQVHREGAEKEFRLALRQSLRLHGTSTSVTTEWPTRTDRRLDLLIKIFDQNRTLIGVVGIENKHWAEEQEDQVGDYQAELVDRFPNVKDRILLFLSPGARPSSTFVRDSACPHIPCSYKSVVAALAELESTAEGELRVLVTSLKSHLDKTLEGSNAMNKEVRELVHSLYGRHQKTIKLILENIPRLGALVGKVQASVEEHLKKRAIADEFRFSSYPAYQSDRLQEFYAVPGRWDSLAYTDDGFVIYYVLGPDKNRNAPECPDLRDYVTVQVRAWCNRKADRENVDDLQLAEALNPSKTCDSRWSYGWKVIWTGKSHQLKDLAENDITAISELFIVAIDATYEPLKKVLDEKYLPTNEDD